MDKSNLSYQIKRKSIGYSVKTFRFVLLFGICYLLLFPIIYLVITAVQDPESMKDLTVIWVPKALSFENFINAFTHLNYGKSFVFSLFLSTVCTLLTLASCSMAGYGLARFKFFEKNIAFVLVILLILIPPQTTMLSTFLNFRFFDFFGISNLIGADSINLINSPLTMILPAMFASGIRSGLSIFIFRQFFLGQPKELEEAAKIDGCGTFKTYIRVMLPLSTPAIITVAVFTFVWYWNDAFYSDLFFNDGVMPLTATLAALRAEFQISNELGRQVYTVQEQRAILGAASILCILPPLIFYIIIQRKFIQSIERTGIVG